MIFIVLFKMLFLLSTNHNTIDVYTYNVPLIIKLTRLRSGVAALYETCSFE